MTFFSVSLDDKNLEPDPHQLEKWDPDPHRNVLDPPHCLEGTVPVPTGTVLHSTAYGTGTYFITNY